MNDNYIDLFAAIYAQAVRDDCAEVSKKTVDKLTKSGISKRLAHDYIKQNSELIKDKVRRNVYQEALNYGDKTKKMQMQNIDILVTRLVEDYGRRK